MHWYSTHTRPDTQDTPGGTTEVNGAPGNMQGNLVGMITKY